MPTPDTAQPTRHASLKQLLEQASAQRFLAVTPSEDRGGRAAAVTGRGRRRGESRLMLAMSWRDRCLWGLALALVGYWAPWLPATAAALQLNGFELAEWVTFLPEVRDGSASIGRLTFLAPLACLAVAWAWAAPTSRSRALRVFLSFSGAGLSLLLLPAYPAILTSMSDAELRPTLILATLTAVGALAALPLTWRVPGIARALILVLGIVALLNGLRGALGLRAAYARLLGQPLQPAWGWWVMMAGIVLAITAALAGLIIRTQNDADASRAD